MRNWPLMQWWKVSSFITPGSLQKAVSPAGLSLCLGACLLCVRVCVQPLWLKSPRPLFHKEWGTVNSCSSESLPKSIEQANLGCTDTPPHRCTGPTSILQRLSDAKASIKVCQPAQPLLHSVENKIWLSVFIFPSASVGIGLVEPNFYKQPSTQPQ